MQYSIGLLQEAHKNILVRIKAGEKELIAEKVELEKAIGWLAKIKELQLEKVSKYDWISLPDMKTGYSEYHIMDDCESDCIEDWIELKDEQGITITATMDDVLIIPKRK